MIEVAAIAAAVAAVSSVNNTRAVQPDPFTIDGECVEVMPAAVPALPAPLPALDAA